MENLDKIIANNIVLLRKKRKWTQAELAEKINYTDKAISKWERAESIPDANVLFAMSNIFEVDVDFFFHEHNLNDIAIKKDTLNSIFLLVLMILAIYFIAIIIFVYGKIKPSGSINGIWISYVYATSVSLIASTIFFKKNHFYLVSMIISSCLVWVILANVYLQCMIFNLDYWLIFIVGIPIQAAIVIEYLINRKK